MPIQATSRQREPPPAPGDRRVRARAPTPPPRRRRLERLLGPHLDGLVAGHANQAMPHWLATALLEAADRRLPPGSPRRLRVTGAGHTAQALRRLAPLRGWELSDHGEPGRLELDGIADPTLQTRARELAAQAVARGRETLRAFLDDEPRPTALFIADNVYYNQLRISAALRERGWRTASVCIHPSKGLHQERWFDLQVHLDLATLLDELPRLRATTLHTQGWLNAYHLPALVEAYRPPGCMHVAELMDVQHFFFPEAEKPRWAGPSRQTWGDGAVDHIALEHRCETFLLEHAPCVAFTGLRRQIPWLCELGADPRRLLPFPCYPLSRFFANPTSPPIGKPWRLAFVGGIPPFDARHPHALFGDAQLLDTLPLLLRQGIYVDLFLNPARTEDPGRAYAPLLLLERTSTGLRLYQGRPPWDLAPALQSYHFGMMLYRFNGLVVGRRHLHGILPSKLFQYLEAGLPVLVSEQLREAADFVRRTGIGLVVADDDLPRLARLLERADLEAMRRRVQQVRDRWCMERRVVHLERRYRLSPVD